MELEINEGDFPANMNKKLMDTQLSSSFNRIMKKFFSSFKTVVVKLYEKFVNAVSCTVKNFLKF